jgi:hypothetical protein
LVVIRESKEYERRRSAFDISTFRRKIRSPGWWLPLTYPGLPDLWKNVAETLYSTVNSLCMNIKPIDGLGGLFGIKIKVGVKHVQIKRRPSGWKTQVLWELAFPFLQFRCTVIRTRYIRDQTMLTCSLSQLKKKVKISAYRATGCLTIVARYLSRSPRRASTNSSLKRPE